MKNIFGIEIDPCPKHESTTCKFYHKSTSCYCSAINWQKWFNFKTLSNKSPDNFACVKYPSPRLHL
jgi:hypothetical protein